GPELGLARVPDRGDHTFADGTVLDVRVRATGREQPEEVRLAGPVGPEHGHPLAVPDLEVEGLHQAEKLHPLADDGALAGAAAFQPHGHLLLARDRLRRTGFLELAQPGLRRAVLRGQSVVVLRL